MLDNELSRIGRFEECLSELLRYRAHDSNCEIDQTDFCTCGLKQVVDKARELLKRMV